MRLGRTLFGCVVALTALTVGCGTDGGSTDRLLRVFVHPVSGITIEGVKDAFPDNAQAVRVSVSGSDTGRVASVDVPVGARQTDLPPFSYGAGRQVTVEVLADDGAGNQVVVSRGRTVARKILSGDHESSLNVFVSPINSFGSPVAPPDNPDDGPIPTRLVVGERLGASVTLLQDGRVLIAGGATPAVGGATGIGSPEDISDVTGAAELFDPETGLFDRLESDLNTPRAYHQAVLLKDGRVVIMGGYERNVNAIVPSRRVEVFDPRSRTFEAQEHDLGAPRANFTAGLAVPDHNVIFYAGGRTDPPVAGGYWEVYMVGVGPVGYGPLKDERARWNHTMTYLPGFRATTGNPGSPAFVIVGGEDSTGLVDLVEAYTGPTQSPGGDSLVMTLDEGSVAPMPGGTPRTLHSAVFVPMQRIVYVIGGFTQKGLQAPTDRVDIFWEASGVFDKNIWAEPRGAATAVLMDQNAILIAGGLGANQVPLSSTEVVMETVVTDDEGNQFYTPVVVADRTPLLPKPRYGHAALFDATRRVLFVGGLTQASTLVPVADSALYYNPE